MSVGEERIASRVPKSHRPPGTVWCDRCKGELGRRARAVTIKAHAHHGDLTNGSQYMLCTGCSKRMARWLEELKGESS